MLTVFYPAKAVVPLLTTKQENSIGGMTAWKHEETKKEREREQERGIESVREITLREWRIVFNAGLIENGRKCNRGTIVHATL